MPSHDTQGSGPGPGCTRARFCPCAVRAGQQGHWRSHSPPTVHRPPMPPQSYGKEYKLSAVVVLCNAPVGAGEALCRSSIVDAPPARRVAF